MADDHPLDRYSVSLGELRESLEYRRQCRIQAKLDPDEVTPWLKIQAEIEAERKANSKRKGWRR